jgi:peroxiredoxin Q/BCP
MSDTSLQMGHPLPDFPATSTAGQDIRLSDLRGKAVVLYFYPKDDTPGCTQEGKDFRDLHARFQERGAVILGVSRDSLKSHDKFRCKYEFPFELLSDPDESLCTLFDVIRQKNMYGKPVRGIERSTFLIDRQGRLAAQWRKVKVAGHAVEVLAAVETLPA